METSNSPSTASVLLGFSRVLVLHVLMGALGVLVCPSHRASAQVFGPGPSDPSLFNTVISLPPTPNIGDFRRTGSDTQVNLADGRRIGDNYRVETGSELNVYGGTIGTALRADSGSEVNLLGGTIGDVFRPHANSDVGLFGGEFVLDGVDFTDPIVSLAGNVFTGTLSDGSTFIFHEHSNFSFRNVRLTATTLPPIDTTPRVVDSPVTTGPSGLRAGQSTTLVDGGVLGPNFAVVDATLDVMGGTLGEGAEVARSVININDGTIGENFSAFKGSTVNISGGTVGDHFSAYSGSTVNISGGQIGFNVQAEVESVVNISGGEFAGGFQNSTNTVTTVTGGNFGDSFRNFNSTVHISGGNFGNGFLARTDSDVTLAGGEFKLNGVDLPRTQPRITLERGDIFSGTLADGSPFVFVEDSDFFGSPRDGDVLQNVNLSAQTLPPLVTTPIVVDGNSSSPPNGLREGQTLVLRAGGALAKNLSFVGSTIDVEGGSIGTGAEFYQSVLNMSEGNLGDEFQLLEGSQLNISGGTVGERLETYAGSQLNLSGGIIAGGITVNSFGEVNIQGGQIVDRLLAHQESELNIYGGSIDGLMTFTGKLLTIAGGSFASRLTMSGDKATISGGEFLDSLYVGAFAEVDISGGDLDGVMHFFNGSTINLFGTQFELDGQLLSNLQLNQAFRIRDRDVTLSGLLADGTPFSLDLNSVRDPSADFVESLVNLNITKVIPEPRAVILILLAMICFTSARTSLAG